MPWMGQSQRLMEMWAGAGDGSNPSPTPGLNVITVVVERPSALFLTSFGYISDLG